VAVGGVAVYQGTAVTDDALERCAVGEKSPLLSLSGFASPQGDQRCVAVADLESPQPGTMRLCTRQFLLDTFGSADALTDRVMVRLQQGWCSSKISRGAGTHVSEAKHGAPGRTRESDRAASLASAPNEVCAGAILTRSGGPEHQATRALPQPTHNTGYASHRLGENEKRKLLAVISQRRGCSAETTFSTPTPVNDSYLFRRVSNTLDENARSFAAALLKAVSPVLCITNKQMFVVNPSNLGARPIAWSCIPINVAPNQAPLSSHADKCVIPAKKSGVIEVLGNVLRVRRYYDSRSGRTSNHRH
jgi:hypothetical protein